MGNGAGFRAGNFNEYYTVKYIAGIKVIAKRGEDAWHAGTPAHSHTPNTMYAKLDRDMKVQQVTIYENSRRVKDIDWGHKHRQYEKGQVHVHIYLSNGERVLTKPSKRDMEIAETIRRMDNEQQR